MQELPWFSAAVAAALCRAAPYLMQQVAPLDQLLHDEQAAGVVLVIVVILADAIARSDVPARKKFGVGRDAHIGMRCERAYMCCSLMGDLRHDLGLLDEAEAVAAALQHVFLEHLRAAVRDAAWVTMCSC